MMSEMEFGVELREMWALYKQGKSGPKWSMYERVLRDASEFDAVWRAGRRVMENDPVNWGLFMDALTDGAPVYARAHQLWEDIQSIKEILERAESILEATAPSEWHALKVAKRDDDDDAQNAAREELFAVAEEEWGVHALAIQLLMKRSEQVKSIEAEAFSVARRLHFGGDDLPVV